MPINTVVIVIIAILIFMSIGLVFTNSVNQHKSTITDAEALQTGCSRWVELGCKLGRYSSGHMIPFITIQNYDPDNNGISSSDKNNDGTLREACKRLIYGKEPSDSSKYEQCELALKCQSYCCGKTDFRDANDCSEKA